MNLNIGDNGAITGATSNQSIGILDTTGGILNADLGTVTLGIHPNGANTPLAGASGSWVLGVAANTVTISTLNLTNYTVGTSTAGNINGVFSLNGGTVNFAPGGTGIFVEGTSSPSNAIVNLNGGTLNMNGLPIGTSGKPINFFNMTGGTLQDATNVFVTATTNNFIQTGGTILVDTSSQSGNVMTTTIKVVIPLRVERL